jgi:HD superfamily phosphohydrolase YqeK
VAGKEWFSQIESASSRARVLIAVIGPDWKPRDSKDDWVSRELKAAFTQQVPVLPLLVAKAKLPHPDDLPEELAPLCGIQCLRIEERPTDSNCYALTDALRRLGIRPVQNMDPWHGLHIDTPCIEMWQAPVFRVVLVTGRPGSGRTDILRHFRDQLRARASEGGGEASGSRALVGWHAPLQTSTHHDCAILYDWLPDIFQDVSRDHFQTLGHTLLDSGIVEVPTHLVPLAALAARFDLDLRLEVVTSVGRGQGKALPSDTQRHLDATHSDAAGRLPLALAAKVLGNLGWSAHLPTMPLVLIVDDFDFADARSRDFVRELVRARLMANGHGQDRPLTLVLNTEDADRTEVLLGFRGADGDAVVRLERLITGASPKDGQKTQVEEFARKCLQCGSASAKKNILLERLTSVCQSPFEVEVVLRHLYRQGKVTQSNSGEWKANLTPAQSREWDASDGRPPDKLREQALDETIDLWLEPAMQQILETGALVGMSFVADFADTAVNGDNAGALSRSMKSMWQQIRESDRDEVIVRCRKVDGRAIITFTSALWRQHLRDRADDQALRERRIKTLSERYAGAAKATDRYDDWMTTAALATQIGAHDAAGCAFLNAARLARQELSVDVAADRYFDARDSFSLVAATEDTAIRARALTAMAFATLQAISLRLRSPWGGGGDLKKHEKDLEQAHRMIFQIRGAVNLLPFPTGIGRIENLALDLTDSYLSDADKLAARRHSLAAHLGILRGHLKLLAHPDAARLGLDMPRGAPFGPRDPSRVAREAEWFFAGALCDAEQGLGSPIRRHLVILSATGMAQALALKALGLRSTAASCHTTKALENVVSSALFHACRALLLLGRWRGAFADPLSINDMEESEDQLHKCLEELGTSREVTLDVRRGQEVAPQSVADLTAAWARALAPQKYQHMRCVRAIAAKLARAMRPHLEASEPLWDEDIRIVAFAHDLFRDVEPSRVLALFRELDMPGLRIDKASSQQPEDGKPRDWIQPTEWTSPILLHGRLAAVFLDFVLDAGSRLGTDRFSQIKMALATHTVGMWNAPPLARLLVVADTLHVTSKDLKSCERTIAGQWHQQIEKACTDDPRLVAAYGLCIQARVEHLDHLGVTPAEETLKIAEETRRSLPEARPTR